jgi:MFS family permease
MATIPVCYALHTLTLEQMYAVTFAAGTLSVLFAIIRPSLAAVAVINLFDLMFLALFTLYAVRVLDVRPGMLGVVLGAGAVGGVLGSLLTKRLAARIGVGKAYLAGCHGFTVPLALVPLAPPDGGPEVLAMLFAAEFASGFGVMVLDISIGSIFAAVIPDTVRSRVMGAFQAVNYGTRPAGALLGGLLGSTLGLRPALCAAAAGAVFGALLLLPSQVPGFRMPG